MTETIRVQDDVLQALSWQTVLDAVKLHCRTDMGRDRIEQLPFSSNAVHTQMELQLVAEMQRLRAQDLEPKLSGCSEFNSQLRRVAEGRMLNGEEFVALGNTLRSAAHIRSGLQSHSVDEYPLLHAHCVDMTDTLPDARWILSTFEPSGRVRDDATPKLSELRRNHVRLLQRTKRAMEDYIHSFELQEYLQDSYYTIRDERYVLPVKAQYRPRVPGIIHGSSGTGATVYVEPEAMVGANNELLLLHEEMEREIERILLDCTERLLNSLDSLSDTMEILASVDSWSSRAAFADEHSCNSPEVHVLGDTRIINGRNPLLLLKGTPVVPNTIQLENKKQFLVITGPNTGGKTVTLITLGLCTLMTAAGIPIPADEGSMIGLFPRIYTLFGDPQDIAADRSTFSGQLERVRAVLDTAGPGSLILMDEPIVGTEPNGGSALAISVMEYLADRGAKGAVTTHYDRLKTLSLEDERFENASVGFHDGDYRPNYVLTHGVSGSSSPITIAKQLGLKEAVIERARKLAGEGSEELQQVIQRLEEQRNSLREAEQKARQKEEQLNALRLKLIARGKEEARKTQEATLKVISDAEDRAKGAIRALQEASDPRHIQRIQKRIETARKRVEEALPGTPPPSLPRATASSGKTPLKPLQFEELREGMRVYYPAQKKSVEITQTPDTPGRIPIRMGNLKLRVPISELAQIPEDQGAQRESPKPVSSEAASALPPRTVDVEIDVRGARVDEALDVIAQRMDRATLEGRDGVFIIHGHGSGALKKAIRKHLSRSPYVEEWHPASPEDGGDGITTVRLK